MIALLALSLTLTASEPALDTARNAARFADHLAQEGDHYRAIGEYKRALFLAPEADESERWRFRIGESYRLGEQYLAAAELFEDLSKNSLSLRADALLGAARSWQGAARYESAIARAREAAEAYGAGSPGAREAHYVEGWSLLLSSQKGRDEEAARAFSKARGEGTLGEKSEAMVNALPKLDALPSRNPAVAGVLGIVPGLGHLYIGEPATAVSALVWNGLFTWALVEAIRAKNYSLAVVLGLFEVMWYGGSITGAVGGAQRFNRDARLNAIDSLGSVASPNLLDEIVARPFP